MEPEDDLAAHRAEVVVIPDQTERNEVRRALAGQGRFRQCLLEVWGGRCVVTGVGVPALLTASHIRPWRASSNAERLDPYNGLLLLPQYDRLFDQGLITFEDDGRVRLSGGISAEECVAAGVSPDARLRQVGDRHRPFLAFHRDHVFVAPQPQAPA